ncbi:MAG: ComF family protein [Pseudomonadota bacterium]|nr:ComF family protein [Pseudomonadota bacterium]
MLKTILNNCLHIVQTGITQPCVLCGARVRGRLICAACADDLPHLPAQRCPQCALPSPGGLLCGACLKKPPRFEHCEAVYRYAFPLDVLIQQCKYAGAQELAELFAEALAQRLADLPRPDLPLPDLIVPMPLHPARLRERGFNQALEIARRLGDRLNLPCRHACQRVRDTPPQAGLDLKARKRNLRGAFVCDENLAGARIALLDDVMTSGSSLNELAQAARRAGAVEISAWVVARTLKP